MKRAEEASAQRPDDELLNAIQLPMFRAAADPTKAIDLLQSVARYERARPEAAYLRGLSYLRAGKGVEASSEFQKILDHKSANWGTFYPISYVGLARGAILAGDSVRAKRAYQDFLALWKDADPDISLLKEAHKEYAALK